MIKQLIIFLSVFFLVSCSYRVGYAPKTYVRYCRVVSIISEPRCSVFPDMKWKYYTDCGIITFNYDRYKVGDSFEIQIVK